jgi:oxygen-independent coproporphyrinogen-3 oxidase
MALPPLGLYVHLPWCERKCPYCDFNSHEAVDIPESDYVQALLRDLDGDLCQVAGRTVETVFIGGGTPSLFSAKAITQLLEGIRERVELDIAVEITMEANPGSAEAEKFQGFRAAGINRLSLGVQSFDNGHLQSLGRIHNAGQARTAFAMGRAAGFENINLDLMHGLPDQSLASARSDLQNAIELAPEHLSWYQLTIEPNTRFHKHPPLLPLEDVLADIQDEGESLLAATGYSQYEVSAYAQTGRECRHNLNYWSFGDYLGIGAGAHGKITSPSGSILRYNKTRQPGDYLANSGESVADSRELTIIDTVGEFMLYALRLNRGFSLDLFEQRTGLERTLIRDRLQQLQDRELLIIDESGIRASALGARYLDSVIGEFFPD